MRGCSGRQGRQGRPQWRASGSERLSGMQEAAGAQWAAWLAAAREPAAWVEELEAAAGTQGEELLNRCFGKRRCSATTSGMA